MEALDDLRDALSWSLQVAERVYGPDSVTAAVAAADDAAFAGVPTEELRRVAASFRAASEAAQRARAEAADVFDAVKRHQA